MINVIKKSQTARLASYKDKQTARIKIKPLSDINPQTNAFQMEQSVPVERIIREERKAVVVTETS